MNTTTWNVAATTVANRCSVCAQAFFVKLTRDPVGALRRDAYCPACDVSPTALEVTTPAGRRAAFVRANGGHELRRTA